MMTRIAASLALLLSGLPAEAQENPRQDLTIEVKRDKWGNASIADIRAVLNSSAGELWKHMPDGRLDTILVTRSRKSPIVLHARGPKREYRVKLNVTNTHWAQFAYQFAHEFCHILANYDEDGDPNEWFEEAVCETASLFALRRMAVTWRTRPPYPNWKDYSKALKKYADKRIREQDLPEGTTVAAFYEKHREELRMDKTNRKLNGVVAVQLLPLFEESPEHWEALRWLNGSSGKDRSFADYLRGWHREAPERHRDFIARIGKLFDVTLD